MIQEWYQQVQFLMVHVPLVVWPVVLVWTMMMPMIPLVVLPISTMVYQYGSIVYHNIVVPTPERVMEFMSWLHATIYHWWIRFVGRVTMTTNDNDGGGDAQCRANIQTRRRTALALSIATKVARSHLSADATTNGPAKRQRN
jgi:hypothetical protein